MEKTEIEQAFEEMINKIDLEKELRFIFFGGFETYEDYEKYGDSFIEIATDSGPRQLPWWRNR